MADVLEDSALAALVVRLDQRNPMTSAERTDLADSDVDGSPCSMTAPELLVGLHEFH